MEGLISIRSCVEALILLIFFFGKPAVPDTTPSRPIGVADGPSSSPSAETHNHPLNPTDLVSNTHGSSSPPPMQIHSDDRSTTTLNNGTCGSSPSSLSAGNHGNSPNMTGLSHRAPIASSSTPESHSFTPDSRTHKSSPSPHVAARSSDLNIARPVVTEARSSSPPLMEPYGPTRSAGVSFFPNAHDFVINFQGDSNTVVQGMKALSECAIKGAAYDSSLRDPPPQCHPGTRILLRQKIIVWFRSNEQEKALLWLNGPAGVGKSAIVQTVTESLAESNSVGASLFFSRLSKRNDPQRVFITIAFQLATEIPAYRIYITEQISLDPSLLEKGMKDQFRIFITEPFGNRGIGKGEGPWAILLDGLDECEGVNEQCRIVRLVSEFICTFPHAPIIWVIASRPEPHIVATFNDRAIASNCWSEYVPVDSTQACKDVEHYLDVSFKAMREPFPHLPSDWPSETQFLKLARGALGLFAFARTAVRFMEDPDHANPVSRLDLLLSIIDRMDITVVGDHPFALLDALYTQILSSIPASVWCTTKQILGFVLCTRSDGTNDGLSYSLVPECDSLMGASTIFGFGLSAAYGSLHKLHSVLKLPDSKNAHKSKVTFFHASFGDYLTDRARSMSFYIDRVECVDDIIRCLFQLYFDKPWDTNWSQYTNQLSLTDGSSFYWALETSAQVNMHCIISGKLRSRPGRGPLESQQDRLECLAGLSRIDLVRVYILAGFHGETIAFLIELWNRFREELEHTGPFKEVLLRDLEMNHLDHERNMPIFHRGGSAGTWVARSPSELEKFTIALRKYQLSHPGRQVTVCGGLPEKRIAFFAGVYLNFEGYFCFPYPY